MTVLAPVDPSPWEPEAPVVAPRVVVASVLLVAAVLPLLVQLPHDRAAVDATLPLMAWLVLGVAGVVALDRGTRPLLAWACVIAATTPAVLLASGAVWQAGDQADPTLTRVARAWGPLTLLLVALPAIAAVIVAAAPGRARSDRRWAVWIVLCCVAAFAAAGIAWRSGTPAIYGAVASIGIGLVALVVGLSEFVARPRPIIEPLVDVGLVLSGVAVAAGAGWIVLSVARHERIFGATALSACAIAATAVLVLPAIWWLRRDFLVRRYGRGALSAEEISSLTADLKSADDPRQILRKAAEMVRATSGVDATTLVLDDVPTPDGWEGRQLRVGDELVGTMLLRPSHPGGLEARQEKVACQLLPTVALIARAVALAVEAAHARDDLVHQRQQERARMLADLHDDLGPMLAGMSMRVAAAREIYGLPELDDLATDLAGCRAGLRRIVSGLAPPDLENGDVTAAIERLVASFDAGSEVCVLLTGPVPDHVPPHASVVAYRAIAEGITNALKHASATEIRVSIVRRRCELLVEVSDDGRGGSLVPGVGLQSLRDRAEEVGGTLAVGLAEGGGARLVLTIPEATG